ncbi:transposase [Streptomyces sp. NPDC057910]|uniref:transposase n=1 Tax=Streptomyces sp. NPDC057910 TaxID=3346278 RepID=UPI0036F0A990
MLRLVMDLPDPAAATPRVLGIDDFATGAPVDVLEDREADTAAAWLRAHPGIERICRDRAGSYSSAARTAAPDAVQTTDRWHVWNNLCEAIEKGVTAHRACLAASAGEPEADPDRAGEVQLPEGARAAAVRQRYADVHALSDRGIGIGRICDRLHLDPKTLRRYARAATVEELLTQPRLGRRALTRYVPYLNQRWNEGCTDSGRLFRELQELGYRGSDRSVRRWLEPLRSAGAPPARIPEAPTVRQVTAWLTRHPDSLIDQETLRLTRVLEHCPKLADTAERVRDFAKMMTQLEGDRLLIRLDAADQAALPALRGFARNLRNDLPAVVQGLSTRWNSGIVEGRVTDIKAIKRQMAGRSAFRLLRKRVLLVAASRRPP